MWNECGDAGQKEGYRLGISGLHLVCHQPVTHPQNPLVEGLPKHWARLVGTAQATAEGHAGDDAWFTMNPGRHFQCNCSTNVIL